MYANFKWHFLHCSDTTGVRGLAVVHYVAVNNWVSPTGGIVYAMKYFQYLFVPLCAKYFYFSKHWQDGFDRWRAGHVFPKIYN